MTSSVFLRASGREARETAAAGACAGFCAMSAPSGVMVGVRTLKPASVSSVGSVLKASVRWRRWSVPSGLRPESSCESRPGSWGRRFW